MKSIFDRFCEEIQFVKTNDFQDFEIKKASLVAANLFEIKFENPTTVNFEAMQLLLNKITQNFKYKVKFSLNVIAPIYNSIEIKKYLQWIIEQYFDGRPLAQLVGDAIVNVEGDGLVNLSFSNQFTKQKFQQIEPQLQKIMVKFGFQKIVFSSQIRNKDNILDNAKAKIIEEAKKYQATKKQFASIDKSNGSNFAQIAIKDIYSKEHYNRVAISGIVFNVAERKTKNETVIFIFSVTDYTEAIFVKIFATSANQIEHLRQIQVNNNVVVKGSLQFDAYTKEKTIFTNSIKVVSSFASIRNDDASQKRVELAFKTKMSTMNGILSPREIIERAQRWDHSAVAIIDTSSVQAFPDLHDATKDSGIKAIYGSTIDLISHNINAIYNPRNQKLLDDEYVVFDLETTGLSPEHDDLIEFGAVIVSKNQNLKRHNFFIKPSKPIPKSITELTKITEEMVQNGRSEKVAMQEIIAWIGSRTLVAHNAIFDFTFLQTKAKKYNLKPIQNPVIDSLVTSRIVFPNAKQFKLERIARKYGSYYDWSSAHRANYDAQILSEIFTKQLYDLEKLNIITQDDLYHYKKPHLYEKAFSYSMSVLAKNQAGLKELFQLMSKALTTNFYGRASVFIDDVVNQKNLLTGSGGIQSKLFDLIFTGSKAQIQAEITKYDYIEINPPQTFAHKIRDGYEWEKLYEMLKFIIKEAKAQKKIVVATGDVHYLDPNEKVYHEIYINAKGLGGVRHHLFQYEKQNRNYPDLHFLTTKEMLRQFDFLGDPKLAYEIVVTNSNLIANMIEKVSVIKDTLYTPEIDDANEKLEKLVYLATEKKYGKPIPELIINRIKREIEPIKKYGFGVIYWLSHLLVTKSLRDGYLVGSRGSVGSSFVAYMADITEVNPLMPHYLCPTCYHNEFIDDPDISSGYDLSPKKCPRCSTAMTKDGQKIPFETFLGFDADKVPDIDLNFSGDYQKKIHDEVKKIFGKTHSFRAGTISTVAERTAFGYVKSWAEDNNKTISRAFIDFLARKVTGTKRTTGQHPGGIIVIPKKMQVEDFTPINYPANDKSSSWKTTHFDFHAIHDNVLKLDLLGHDDPTAIKYLEKLTGVNARNDIPFYDSKVISLFSSTKALGITTNDIEGETTGVMGIPEFGTTFVRRMLKSAKVSSFSDLIAVSGLSHGTDVWANNADLVIKEQGKKLSQVISCRDNIMTDLIDKRIDDSLAFQIMEQVRKGQSITNAQETILKKNNVENWYIESLKKIKYMFPKAHATAYVMMAWRIAWFKLYHPLAYYATFFTTRADVFDVEVVINGKDATLKKLKSLKSRRNEKNENALSNKDIALIPILELVNEAFARKVKISNISLAKSKVKHWIIDNDTLIPPFVAVDGLGEVVASSIVKARTEKMFISIEDLKARTIINVPSLNKLKALGVFLEISEKNQMAIKF